jgi:hypothetical protein
VADLVGIALALCVIGLGGLVALDRLVRKPDYVVTGLFVARGFVPAVSGLAGAFIVSEGLSGPELWLGRLSTLLFVLAVTFALLRPRPRDAGRLVMLAGVAHYGAAALVGLLMIETVDVEILQGTVLVVLGLIAVWGAPRVDARTVARLAKWAFAAQLIGSLIAVVAGAPEAWVAMGSSWIPGVDLRLQGATYHPNVLGPLPVFYLLLERYVPSPRWFRLPMSVLAVAALLLTQSKTSWVGAAVVLLVVWAADPTRARNARLAAGAAVVTLFAGLIVYSSFVNEQIASDVATRFGTLTGRTSLWKMGLRAWTETPILGAGQLFFEDQAARRGQAWAGQAHNQVVQTLTELGLVGLVTLMLYAGALCRSALRSAARSRATSLALVAFLLVRCITETPFTGFSLEHLTIYCLLVAWEREAAGGTGPAGRASRRPSALSAAGAAPRKAPPRTPVPARTAFRGV